ncbi:MAG: response regulator transcription factor [Chloroflexota bacterium]
MSPDQSKSSTGPSAKTILIVEDEDNIREVVRRYLEREGFQVCEAADGYSALDLIAEQEPDLIVMDLMLPGIDGLTLTRQLRQRSRVPVIMLTARGETSDRVRGLDLGADDYMPKPFSPRELVSRIHAILRRAAPTEAARVRFGEVDLDLDSRTVIVREESVKLTAKEFDLLWFLANHPGQVFTRERLLDNVWGKDFAGDPATVTVHIRHLREKIEPDPAKPRHLITVWGVGYRLENAHA